MKGMILVGLGLVAMGLALDTNKLHLHMNEEELRQIFQTGPQEIPDYEVTSLQMPRLHERSSNSGTRIRLNAFGKNINLWLHPTEGTLAAYDTPVYLAKSSSATTTGVRFYKVADDPMTTVGKMLEDREKRATLIVKRSEDGRSLISGVVGSEDWVVKPLPSRFSDHIKSQEGRSNDTIGEYDEPHPHVIFKSPKLPEEAQYINQPIEKNFLGNWTLRFKRDTSADILYPQILVVADYDTYKIHGQNVYSLLEYLLPFWNGVDLRYRGLEYPKVRLNIAGIIIAADPNALSYVSKNKVATNTLDIFGALSDFGNFMPTIKSYFPFPESYDVAVTMAPFDMCSPQENGPCQVGTLGLAYLEGACRINGGQKSLSVSVIQDKGAFDGMHTAAHELGHLLGAGHDGQDDSLCDGDAGHIMASTPVLTENSADWSACSLRAFDNFFKSETPKCLLNEPKTSSPLPRVLPGKLLTLDEQCAKIEGTSWCKTGENPCMRLKCIYKKDNKYCTDVGDAAADGSICDVNKICVHGKCLNEADIV